MRLEVQLLFLVLSTVDSLLDNFEYDVDDIDNRVDADSELDEAEGTCRCVAWSLCDENGYVITDGSEGLLSPRNLFAPTCEECGSCPSAHICCRAPPDEEVWPSWDTCGVNKYKEDVGYRVMNLDRLISQTQFAEFPWTLMVFRAQQKPNGEWKKYMFRGGASIIHPKIALTVAHILWDANETLITVRAGEWNASSNTEEIAHQDRGVQEIIIHPSFDKVSMYNDIALLILDRPFDIAENVAPICLPFPDTKYDPNKCLAAGWGTNRFGPEGRYSTTLRKVSLPLVPEKECEKKLKKSYLGKRFRLHYSFICAGGKPGQDTCMGDGGGPLMCLNDDGAYVQIGIVSWGVECGTEYPAVYTNVSTFLHWIVPVIAKVGDTQP